jgi:glycosyltransferase involved in cell wall biosynthesis
MSSVRVLHFADVVNRYDFIDNVVRNLDATRFEVEVATLTPEANIQSPEYGAAGIRHTVLPSRSRASYPLTALRLASLIAKRHIDVLHAHHFDPNAIAWLSSQLRRSVRVVVGRHYSDAIYLNSSGARQRALLAIERRVNARAARIVAPSTMIRDLLVHRQGVPDAKVDVVPYAFDLARYAPPSDEQRRQTRDTLGISSRFALATVGRLYKDKGHKFMIEALRQLIEEIPELVWLVVGDGADRAELDGLVTSSGLDDRIHFLGWRKDALQVMGAVDAVVQPSLQEAYSQVMVEALAMGTPLVTTDVSGAGDLITSGETGILVGRADVSGLVRAIRTLWQDAALRERLRQRGRQLVESRLSIPSVVPLYEAVYDRAMQS